MISKLVLLISIFQLSFCLYAREGRKIVGKGNEAITISLSSPKSGWTVNRMVKISGTVSDETVNPITVSINGSKYFARTSSGSFSRSFPVNSGMNSIDVIGTNKAGTFKKNVALYGKFPPVPIMIVLSSDTDGVYTDLHIYEPSIDMPLNSEPITHVYWSHTQSPSGGKFYLNNDGDSFDKPGYGPYLYTHRAPPLGFYRIDANYWPSNDMAHSKANLNIVLFAGTPNEVRRNVQYPLVKSGETKTLAWIKIEKNQVAHIYSPIQGAEKDSKIWPAWIK